MKRRPRTRRPRRRTSLKRTYRRRTSKSVLRTVAKAQVYPFRRFVASKVLLNGNDTLPNGAGGVSFQLSDLPSYSELTSLFDQYKIAGVAYRWCITKDPMVISSKVYPRLVQVHDYDDAGVPATTDLYQYTNCNEYWFNETKQCTPWRYIKPARASVEYEGPTNSSYSPKWSGFIDCLSNSAPHYGIKYAYEGLYAGIQMVLQCKYYVVMKTPR